MKQFHAKNHYVPESYLKRWENSDGRVWIYRVLVEHKNIPSWKNLPVSAIAYQKHLYTQVIAGVESDELESWFDAEFESPASGVIDKVIKERKLDSHDWNILIKFLAAQDVRTPARLVEHMTRGRDIIDDVLKEVTHDLQVKLDSGELKDLQEFNTEEEKKFPLKVTEQASDESGDAVLKVQTYAGRSTWIYSMRHLLDNTRKVLHSHSWSIIKPAKGYLWPTSDNPVVKLNYTSSSDYDLKGGWGVKKGNIFFPLSPEYAMFVQIGDRAVQKYTRVSEILTKELIKFACENSYRKIFSQCKSEVIPTLKKRVVDPSPELKEVEAALNWHQVNSEMEVEYMIGNRNA